MHLAIAIMSATPASIFCSSRALARIDIGPGVVAADHIANTPFQHRIAGMRDAARAPRRIKLLGRLAEVLRFGAKFDHRYPLRVSESKRHALMTLIRDARQCRG